MKHKHCLAASPRAYSYIRFSTPEQGKGDSLRRQVDAARICAAGLGLELDESHHDFGRSAYSGAHRTRGALGAFLRVVEAGGVPRGSVLIVESLDRLSREQVLDALEQFRAILKAGVEVLTLSDGQRYTEASVRRDFTQLLVSLLVMARAHEESARKAERVYAAWGQKRLRAAEGEAMTARCVAWCRIVGTGRERRYELIPERAAVVRRIFQETVDGMGRRVIVKRLNMEGTPTWGRSGGWRDSYVAKMLQNRAVMGFGQPHHRTVEGRMPLGGEVAGYYPEAVPPELFHRASAARVRRRGKGGPQGEGVANLFSGLARCGCGATMVHINKGASPKGGRYLQCDRQRRGLACGNPLPSRPYLKVEGLLLVGIMDLDWTALADREAQRERPEEELARVAAERAGKEAEVQRLLDTFADASPIPQVADRIKRLSGEAAALAAQVQSLRRKAASSQVPALSDWRRSFHALMAEMEGAEGESFAAVRTRIAQEIRRVVGRLVFMDESVTVLAPDGAVLHHFLPSPMPLPDDMLRRMRERDRRRALAADGQEKAPAVLAVLE